jgi:uncharacterized protein YjiS (DUF1127 family)
MDTILNVYRSAVAAAGHKEPASRFVTNIAAAVRKLMGWAERARQRHALLTLDDRMLKDIGITRADVMREAGKPFWRE